LFSWIIKEERSFRVGVEFVGEPEASEAPPGGPRETEGPQVRPEALRESKEAPEGPQVRPETSEAPQGGSEATKGS